MNALIRLAVVVTVILPLTLLGCFGPRFAFNREALQSLLHLHPFNSVLQPLLKEVEGLYRRRCVYAYTGKFASKRCTASFKYARATSDIGNFIS